MIEFKKFIHHGYELETAILGACLIEKAAMGRTYGIIQAESFYHSEHQVIYQTMVEMYENSIPIDSYTVSEKIVSKGVNDFNGQQVLFVVTRLTNFVVSSAHLEYHCHLVKDMWRRRRILEIKYSRIEDDLDPVKNADEINQQLREILGGDVKRDWYDMSELIFELIKHQHEVAKGDKVFLTTGFKRADDLNGGFYNGNMIVIGARPSVGKSALMGQMALTMARKGKKVGIVSLEMNNKEIAARLASIETGIDFSKVFRDIAKDEALHKTFYEKVARQTVKLPIRVSDKTKVNVNEIRAKAMKLKASHGCDVIFIDYLQLLDSAHDHNRNSTREQEVAKMSRGIKLMAFELDIPVIVLCQLNRAVTNRSYKDRFPKLSDLRESGAIEQDADVVLFIHRDYMSGWTENDQGMTTEFQADLLCPKWRNGATFHLELDFEPTKMLFKERPTLVQYKPVVELSDDNPF